MGLVETYDWIVSAGDSRSNDLPLVKNPIYVVCAAIAYLVMVTAGPRFMEKRNPLLLRNVLLVYNFISVVLSIWMMYEVSKSLEGTFYTFLLTRLCCAYI